MHSAVMADSIIEYLGGREDLLCDGLRFGPKRKAKKRKMR